MNEHGIEVLDFTLLELAQHGQDLRELEQYHFDLPRPYEPAQGFNNLPKAWGHAPALTEHKMTLALPQDLAQQIDHLQSGSGIGTRLTFLRTLLQSAVQQLQARRVGGLLSVACEPGEAQQFEQLARERNLDLPHLIRQLLLQEVYRGQKLSTGGENDKAPWPRRWHKPWVCATPRPCSAPCSTTRSGAWAYPAPRGRSLFCRGREWVLTE